MRAAPAPDDRPTPGRRPTVTVVGLGPSGPELVPPAARRAMAGGRAVLRTHRHPAAAPFAALASFDHHYDAARDFDEVYRRIVDDLVAAAQAAAADSADSAGRPVVYAVPGSPLVAERTVELLRADVRVDLAVEPALSFLDLAWATLGVDPLAAGVRLVDGTRFAVEAAGERGPLLVAQCWSGDVLSAIKLSLDSEMDQPAAPVTLLHHLGLPDERVEVARWWELDRVLVPDHLTSLWIPELAAPVAGEIVQLEELVRRLRRDCPWDREQTHRSLGRHLLEESYEVLDAVEALAAAEATVAGEAPAGQATVAREAPAGQAPAAGEAAAVAHLEEELGDLLFQVVFHAGLATEEGRFTLADVARRVHEKLVSRHPHVFGDVVAETPDAVAANWEVLKKAEKGRRSVTDGIPAALPALALASKLLGKASSVGLAADAPPANADAVDADRALGAQLLGLVVAARLEGIDAEAALRAAALELRERIVAAEDATAEDATAEDALHEVRRARG